jgi:hypothetical protein
VGLRMLARLQSHVATVFPCAGERVEVKAGLAANTREYGIFTQSSIHYFHGMERIKG